MSLNLLDIKKLIKLSSFLDAIKSEGEDREEIDFLDQLIKGLIHSESEIPDLPGVDEEEDEGYMAVFDLSSGDSVDLEEKISNMPVEDLTDVLMESKGKEELKELIEALKESSD
jgi:hypothetical protein